MSKMISYRTLIVLALALAVMILPACASLVPTSFGFPVIVQSGTTTAFNQDTARANDIENVNINFPVHIGNVGLGPLTVSGALANTDSPTGIAAAIDGNTPAAISAGNDATGVGAKLTANVLPFGPVNLAFPDISQTVLQTQDVTHTDFAQTNEYAQFAYPFVGVGGVSLPGFGFGF